MVSTLLRSSGSVELTFELPDSAKECFYEVIEKGTQATVEFQASPLTFQALNVSKLQSSFLT